MNIDGINLWGLSGILAALVGLVLYGRHLGKKSMEDKITKEQTEKVNLKIQQAISDVVRSSSVENAKVQERADADHQNVRHDIEEAAQESDEERALRIAAETAKKAIEKGAEVRQ